ncbi:hypothetical protein ACFWWU_36440 [Streptomyces sp. NPDC058650]|uniref:hypothetical protein n=1 Tax=Streptomyces sp. NPDC058650 TaxID=3346575 RepID=UPI003646D080
MSIQDAARSASIAANQAIDAVNVIQRGGVVTPDDHYRENLALAVSNLAIAVKQLAEARS